jgi:hypothetical protein
MAVNKCKILVEFVYNSQLCITVSLSTANIEKFRKQHKCMVHFRSVQYTIKMYGTALMSMYGTEVHYISVEYIKVSSVPQSRGAKCGAGS